MMMTTALRLSAVTLSLIALTACGGGSTSNEQPVEEEPDFADLIAEAEGVADRAVSNRDGDRLFNTVIAQVPDAGSASFSGPAFVNFGSAVRMLGDGTLDVDFASRALTGEITDLVAQTDDADMVTVTGTISMNEALIGSPASDGRRGNQFSGLWEGELTAGDMRMVTEGLFEGTFVGTAPDLDMPIRAVDVVTDIGEGTITQNSAEGEPVVSQYSVDLSFTGTPD